jgi:hypothetical protein
MTKIVKRFMRVKLIGWAKLMRCRQQVLKYPIQPIYVSLSTQWVPLLGRGYEPLSLCYLLDECRLDPLHHSP